MKFVKFFISRAMLTAILLLLQVVTVLYSLFHLGEAFFQIYIVLEVLSFIVAFYVLSKDSDPSTKLPWVVLIVMAPPFGAIIYAMFQSNNPRKKHLKISRLMFAQHTFNNHTTKSVKAQLKSKGARAFGQTNYLERTSGTPTYKNINLKYYESGELFFKDLLAKLKSAKKFVFMEYFIIQDGVMWQQIYEILKAKAKQGVEVIVMYDDIGSIYKLPYNFDKKNSAENLNIVKFNKFRPIVSAVHNNRDHRKITIIDGKIAFTGGINIADEYINQKVVFGHWKDTGIMVQGQAVDAFTNEFLKLYYLNGLTLPDTQKYFPVHKEDDGFGFTHVFFDGPHPLFKDRVGQNAYLNIINQAKDYLFITTPYLIVDYNFLHALKSAARRGVDVRIITPHIPDKKIIFMQTRSNYKSLLQAGVKIYEYLPGFMHAKTIISDDLFAIVGTFNLDYRSFVHHFENGVWIYDHPVIADIKKDVDAVITVSKEIQLGNYSNGFVTRLVSRMLSIFSALM